MAPKAAEPTPQCSTPRGGRGSNRNRRGAGEAQRHFQAHPRPGARRTPIAENTGAAADFTSDARAWRRASATQARSACIAVKRRCVQGQLAQQDCQWRGGNSGRETTGTVAVVTARSESWQICHSQPAPMCITQPFACHLQARKSNNRPHSWDVSIR